MGEFIHIRFSNIYEFKGWVFEQHNYYGGWPLKKNLEPRVRAGKRFWAVYSEFNKLPTKEKETYRHLL